MAEPPSRIATNSVGWHVPKVRKSERWTNGRVRFRDSTRPSQAQGRDPLLFAAASLCHALLRQPRVPGLKYGHSVVYFTSVCWRSIWESLSSSSLAKASSIGPGEFRCFLRAGHDFVAADQRCTPKLVNHGGATHCGLKLEGSPGKLLVHRPSDRGGRSGPVGRPAWHWGRRNIFPPPRQNRACRK